VVRAVVRVQWSNRCLILSTSGQGGQGGQGRYLPSQARVRARTHARTREVCFDPDHLTTLTMESFQISGSEPCYTRRDTARLQPGRLD
jgi:hypothetical protein